MWRTKRFGCNLVHGVLGFDDFEFHIMIEKLKIAEPI